MGKHLNHSKIVDQTKKTTIINHSSNVVVTEEEIILHDALVKQYRFIIELNKQFNKNLPEAIRRDDSHYEFRI